MQALQAVLRFSDNHGLVDEESDALDSAIQYIVTFDPQSIVDRTHEAISGVIAAN